MSVFTFYNYRLLRRNHFLIRLPGATSRSAAVYAAAFAYRISRRPLKGVGPPFLHKLTSSVRIRQGSAEQKGERIVLEELSRLGWNEADLAHRRKSDSDKIKIALRLRRQSSVTFAWIAQRLRMGVATHAANGVYRAIQK